jgi:hypothetical protein
MAACGRMSGVAKELGVGMKGLLAHAARRPCIVCGGSPVVLGIHVAEGEQARRFGSETGKTRVIPYSLCQEHPPGQEVAERVERLLEAFFAAEPPLIFPASQLDRITFFDGSSEA